MDQNNSSFGNNEPISLFEDIQELSKRGATSDTYKIRLYGKWHILKRIKNDFKFNPLYIQAFEKEFDLGYQLDHPNIIKYVSKGSDQNGIYIITEYIEGSNLKEFIANNRGIVNDKKLINKILKQLLSVLDYLHNHQIIHLDIKPENILITTKGRNIKLIDFGFASSDGYEAIACGTKIFASPEQFGDTSSIDVTSDIYAIGRILIYLFTDNTNIDLINKLPQPHRKISKRCLRLKPCKPYKNVQEILNQIEPEKKINLWLLIAGTVFLFFLLYFMVTHYGMNKTIIVNDILSKDSIQFDVSKISNHMDSVFSAFDSRFPVIEPSNIGEVSSEYNKTLNNIYLWKEKQILSLSIIQKMFYEEEFKRIWNEKTKKYVDSFNIVTNEIQTDQ
jgi:serine/threonine protein kinase